MKHIININLSNNPNDSNGEEIKKLYDVLYFRTEKPSKRKKSKLYLTADEIDQLNNRYSAMFKKVGNDIDLSETQRTNEQAYLSEKYDLEIETLSRLREPEYLEQQAKIEAKYAEETPFRRCWLWALLFQPLTNRAQDIIEERAALDAEERFAPLEKELEERAKNLFGDNVYEFSKRKRHRLLKKYLKLQRKLIGSTTAPGTPANAQSETPDTASTALNNVQIQYANHSISGVSFVPRNETLGTAPALSAQPSEPAEPAYSACDAVHHCDVAEDKDTGNVAEPPELPARKPRKPKQSGA